MQSLTKDSQTESRFLIKKNDFQSAEEKYLKN